MQLPTELFFRIMEACATLYAERLAEQDNHFPIAQGFESLSTVALDAFKKDLTSWLLVSVDWRDFCLSATQLWASIAILRPLPEDIARVKLWLKRSKTHPLTIRLEQSEFPEITEAQTTQKLINIFVSERLRWRKVSFELYSCPQIDIQSSVEMEHLGYASLALSSRDWIQEKVHTLWTDIFRASSSLNKIGFSISFSPFDLNLWQNIPWKNLNFIDLCLSIEIEIAIDLLRLCESVEVFCLHEIVPDGNRGEHNPGQLKKLFVLRNLHSLSLSTSKAELALLLRCIMAPNLQRVKIHYDSMARVGHIEDGVELEGLVLRSQLGLRSLRITCSNVRGENFQSMSFLSSSAMQSLQELAIHCSDDLMFALTAPTWNHTEGYFLPNLKCVGLCGHTAGKTKVWLNDVANLRRGVKVVDLNCGVYVT
ncbi:hypothetical protein BDQ12DRAFT_763781 [Crucibulum laeve]|uniref:F-box domain-containing protein n=1 Tax=Crucibulum laeve TaxID=68775 RepID=A0A5C3LPS1_9AGAR|nr:hypothetical protein BDQ12DRAFT_763781 [Crucibulum laeve]